jgi:hypothetical protein
MTYNLKTAKILHRVGRYVVVRDGRQYTVCTDDGQPCNFLGGGVRGLEQATRSANLSAEISQAWEV